MDWVRDKRLYLPFTGQVGNPLYSSTREAVLRLKHPIRGIDRSHNDSEIDQSISDGYMLHQRLMVMKVKCRTHQTSNRLL
jgi:hypothetical protein